MQFPREYTHPDESPDEAETQAMFVACLHGELETKDFKVAELAIEKRPITDTRDPFFIDANPSSPSFEHQLGLKGPAFGLFTTKVMP